MTNDEVPHRILLNCNWNNFGVWEIINKLIKTLPNYFESEIVIKGVDVTDLYSVGAVFSTAIESSLVEALNKSRNIWDAENEYLALSFKRQSQTFPDVLLIDFLITKLYLGLNLKLGMYYRKKENQVLDLRSILMPVQKPIY